MFKSTPSRHPDRASTNDGPLLREGKRHLPGKCLILKDSLNVKALLLSGEISEIRYLSLSPISSSRKQKMHYIQRSQDNPYILFSLDSGSCHTSYIFHRDDLQELEQSLHRFLESPRNSKNSYDLLSFNLTLNRDGHDHPLPTSSLQELQDVWERVPDRPTFYMKEENKGWYIVATETERVNTLHTLSTKEVEDLILFLQEGLQDKKKEVDYDL